jgi:hypothetical protein
MATFRSMGVRKAQVLGEDGRTKRASIPIEKLITPTTCTESVIDSCNFQQNLRENKLP